MFSDSIQHKEEKNEIFMTQPARTIQQMENLATSKSHCPSDLFFLLKSNTLAARNVSKNLQSKSTSIAKIVSEVKNKKLFDNEIQSRRVTSWSFISYKALREATNR